MNDPVFILGCHKSGTSLLRNLLDSHPALFVIPTESHFFESTGNWVNYYSRRTAPATFSHYEIIENLINTIDFANKTTNEVADHFTKGRWDIEILKEVLYSVQTNTLRDISELYIKALYKSLFKCEYNSNLIWIEKSVENTEFTMEWLQLYPNAKFIYILRNPYANLVAIKKFREVNKSAFPIKGALLNMYNSYYFLYKSLNLISPEQFKLIKYEELLANPEFVMKDIANFIGIPFQNILLQPTLLGDLWQGNSSHGNKFSGISKKNINKWKNNIIKSEIMLINNLFPQVLIDNKYEILELSRMNRNTIKNGSIKEMLVNKALKYYLPTFKRHAK